MELRHIADREGKLLSFLRRELQLSSGLCKRLKYEHAFCVNGTAVYTNHIVRPGDVITVRLDEQMPDYPAQAGPLSILYEDEALLAVDKPAGLMVHPSAARDTGTLANRVIWYYQQTGQPCKFHPVTRLDRDTIGIVLLAKHSHIHARMMAAMQAGACIRPIRPGSGEPRGRRRGDRRAHLPPGPPSKCAAAWTRPAKRLGRAGRSFADRQTAACWS